MIASRLLRKPFYGEHGDAVKLCQTLSSEEHDVPRVRRRFTLFSPLHVPFFPLSKVNILKVGTNITINGDLFSVIDITPL